MIQRLRGTDAYVRQLSLLAEFHGEVVGHILLTKANIANGHSAMAVLALAPLSVVPEAQSRGIGKQPVAAAHRRATELGFGAIVPVGNPSYFGPTSPPPSILLRKVATWLAWLTLGATPCTNLV
jgi:predicted N-acetyltransferase YhbS